LGDVNELFTKTRCSFSHLSLPKAINLSPMFRTQAFSDKVATNIGESCAARSFDSIKMPSGRLKNLQSSLSIEAQNPKNPAA
jgi:hypothetical protein